MLLHYHSHGYPSGPVVDLTVCEPYDSSRLWLADQYYRVRLVCGNNICEGYVWRSLVETILLEPLMWLRWERVVGVRLHDEVISLVDGEFWDMSFDYGGISWTLDGHCRYPDKYHEVKSGMVRATTSLLYTQALSEYDMFSERWYSAWCRACRRARPSKWKEPYDQGWFARFMDGLDDLLDRADDAFRRRFSDVSEKTMAFLGSFEE